MIRIVDIPAPPPSAPAGWPGQAAFLASPHIRINDGERVAWEDFSGGNMDAVDGETVDELWNDLVDAGRAKLHGYTIVACGKPGAEVCAFPANRAPAPASARRREPMVDLADLLTANKLSISLGVVEAVLGGVRLTPAANGRSIVGRHFPGQAR